MPAGVPLPCRQKRRCSTGSEACHQGRDYLLTGGKDEIAATSKQAEVICVNLKMVRAPVALSATCACRQSSC